MKTLHVKDTVLDDLWIDTDFNDLEQTNRVAILTHTPTTKKPDVHYHIELEINEAMLLRNWLTEFLKEML